MSERKLQINTKYYYYIYLIKNLINNKIYVGQRVSDQKPEKDCYMGSGQILKKAYKKYGKSQFKKYIVWNTDNLKSLNKNEQIIIKLYKSRNRTIGYNITPGGRGVGFGPDHPRWGKKHNEFQKKRMREVHKGAKRNAEARKRMSEGRKGIKRLEISNKNQSITNTKKSLNRSGQLRFINFDKRQNGYSVKFNISGKTKHCGYFKKLEDAIDLRDNIESVLKQYN